MIDPKAPYHYELSGTYHNGETFTVPLCGRDMPSLDAMRETGLRMISRDARIATMTLTQFDKDYRICGSETLKTIAKDIQAAIDSMK